MCKYKQAKKRVGNSVGVSFSFLVLRYQTFFKCMLKKESVKESKNHPSQMNESRFLYDEPQYR